MSCQSSDLLQYHNVKNKVKYISFIPQANINCCFVTQTKRNTNNIG